MTHSVDPDQTAPSGAGWSGFTLSHHTSVQILSVYLEFPCLKVLLSVFQNVSCLTFSSSLYLAHCFECVSHRIHSSLYILSTLVYWNIVKTGVVPVSSLAWLCEPQDPVQYLHFANTGLLEYCKDWSGTCIKLDLTVWTTWSSSLSHRKLVSTNKPVAFCLVHTGIEPPFLFKINYAITACMTLGFTSRKYWLKEKW